MPGTHYYTEDTILNHIKQLATPFAQHHDALYVLQAGFIGSWGEWHSSLTNLHDIGLVRRCCLVEFSCFLEKQNVIIMMK